VAQVLCGLAPATFVLTFPPMFESQDTKQDSILRAFDRLFERAAVKLHVECTAEERDEARRQFAERFHDALQSVNSVASAPVPESVMAQMEAAIDELSPANIASYLALGPLTAYVQQRLRAIAVRAAEARLLEHLISQADDKYGGN